MKNVFTALFEHKEFKENAPWALTKMTFPTGEVVPPHYADTVEVIFCHGVSGVAYIGGRRYSMNGEKIFFVAPFVVHSFEYKKSEGYINVFKLQISNIKKYLDISAVLSDMGMGFDALICEYVYRENLEKKAKSITDGSQTLVACLASVLEIFEFFAKDSRGDGIAAPFSARSGFLGDVIDWSEQNFRSRISLDTVSEKFGYNKAYFCSLFKSCTGVTYLNYLNNLRISHACRLLRDGASVNEACESCGFETSSYFVQLFKKVVGITPKQYQLTVSEI